MNKLKIGIIFGGMSTEHSVSIVSGTSVIKNLDKNKYEIFPIYIDEDGNWFEYKFDGRILKIDDKIENLEEINNVFEYLKNLDVVFPVLHGLYGEDGTIQGMLELLKIPYVGPKVLGSCVGMDKVYAKIIFDKAQIDQAKYVYIKEFNGNYIYVDEKFNEQICNLEEVCTKITEKIEFPMFVKPSNSGSSKGLNKSHNLEELKEHIKIAAKHDRKILIEENIVGKEVECAVLGNEEVEASCVGEILPAEEFYTFDAKYNMQESKTLIPARLSEGMQDRVRELAKKAYKAIDAKGLSRVDFFVCEEKNKIYINEINTIPGFTNISMYPKLWEASGLKYADLLDKLINLALIK